MSSPLRTCLRLSLVLALTVLGSTAALHAQAASAGKAAQPQPALFRIAGRVVSATDAHPLQATMTVTGVHSGEILASTQSSPSGDFAFDHVPAGKYVLRGDTPGYLAAAFDEHEGFSTAIVTGTPGVATTALTFRLQPAAALRGTVLDEAGEPVRSAQVTLYLENHNTGSREIAQVRVVQTDDRGEYTLGALPRGKYFLAVKAVPWYAMHPQLHDPAGLQNGRGSPLLTGIDPSLDVAYPITFYPDVPDPHTAAPLDLKGGDDLRADFHLAPVPALRIILRTAPGEQPGYPQITTSVFNSTEMMMGQMQTSSYGTEMVGLPPGRYLVQQTNPRTGTASHSSAVDLTNGSAEIDTTEAPAPAALKVTLEDQTGTKLPNAQILLQGATTGDAAAQVTSDKGEAIFSAVRPTDFHLAVNAAGHLYQVLRITGTANMLPGNQLHLTSGETSAIKLTVAATISAVEGTATRDGKPSAGAMIVLVPIDTSGDPETFRRDQSDLDGTFALPEVPAGRYILLAIDDGWTLEWANPIALAPYLLKGTPLQIPATEHSSIRLPGPIPVQPR